MSKYKLRFVFLFFKVLILGSVSAVPTVSVALGEGASSVVWKQVGRKALLHIPAPALTRVDLHSKRTAAIPRAVSKK